MDDLELRRLSLAEPKSTDPEYRQALQEQPGLAAQAKAATELDQALGFALRQPSPPDGLEGRILLRLGLEQRNRRRQRMAASLALAASLLFAATAIIWPPTDKPTAATSFAQLAIEHIQEEAVHLEQLPQSDIAQARLASLFAEVGGQLTGPLSDVRFAYICPTPQGPGLHLISQTKTGPVTVLYVPNAATTAEPENVNEQGFIGLASAAGSGALAVIGNASAGVQQIHTQLQRSVSWPQQAALQTSTADEPWV